MQPKTMQPKNIEKMNIEKMHLIEQNVIMTTGPAGPDAVPQRECGPRDAGGLTRRRLGAAAALLAVLPLQAACGGGEAGRDSAGQAAAAAARGRVVHWSNAQFPFWADIGADFAKEFKEKYPNVEYVTEEVVGDRFENPAAAWKFMEFLAQEDIVLRFAKRYDRIPVRIDVAKGQAYQENAPFLKLAVEEMGVRRFQVAAPGGGEIQALQNQLAADAVSGKRPVREVLTDYARQMQQILDKFKR